MYGREMSSSFEITDPRHLPQNCVCGEYGVGAGGSSYEQLLRTRRTCLNTVTFYDISSIEVTTPGSNYSTDDAVQLSANANCSPRQQNAYLLVTDTDSGGGITAITPVGTFAYSTLPSNPVDATNLKVNTSDAAGAQFTIVWKVKPSSTCCQCVG